MTPLLYFKWAWITPYFGFIPLLFFFDVCSKKYADPQKSITMRHVNVLVYWIGGWIRLPEIILINLIQFGHEERLLYFWGVSTVQARVSNFAYAPILSGDIKLSQRYYSLTIHIPVDSLQCFTLCSLRFLYRYRGLMSSLVYSTYSLVIWSTVGACARGA